VCFTASRIQSVNNRKRIKEGNQSSRMLKQRKNNEEEMKGIKANSTEVRMRMGSRMKERS
jgi:hypothetical protein